MKLSACAIPVLVVAFAARLEGQAIDTLLFTPKAESRLSVMNVALKRAVSVAGSSVTYANASLRGAEAQAIGSRGGGVRIRYETGTLPGGSSVASAGKFESIDGRLLLGVASFSVVPGYLLRSVDWNGEQRRFGLAMLGAELGRRFWGSGFQVRGGAMYLRMPKEAKADSIVASGIEAHTALLYAPPRTPLFVQLGYRREVLAFKNGDVVARREESSGVMLSLGLQAGMPKR